MKQIAEAKGVKLCCPAGGRFAFFNSPFPSHKENTGIDIYPEDGFGGEAPSPVKGEVKLIRRVKAPPGRGFKASSHDTVILIENRENPETVTKLLHVDPLVEVGDSVRVGDPVGVTLRSGYYGWGTSPHIHAEIRDPRDPIRARGGYNLSLIDVRYEEPFTEITGEVVHLQPEFAFIKPKTKSSGLVGTVNGRPSIIEGGIPYYGWLGAHIENPPKEGTIELMGTPIANISEKFSQSCKGEGKDYSFTVKNRKILGLSLTLWPSYDPLIKIIPIKIGGLRLESGEWVEVELRAS